MKYSLYMTLISDEIFDSSSKVPTLLGGRSRLTGEIKFPCPKGALADEFDPFPLKRNGILWSFTIQRFPPGKPYLGVTDLAMFQPFGIGYVELKGQIIVETRIVTDNLEALKIGMPMELILETFQRGDGEGEVTTFAFQPRAEEPL